MQHDEDNEEIRSIAVARGESLSPRPDDTSDLAGAADRAGRVVRDQIASMIEAARRTADEIERAARDSADASRRDAVEATARTVENIAAQEREVTLVLRSVSQEADGLRAKLDRLRLLSAAASEGSAAAAPPRKNEIDGGAQSEIEGDPGTIGAQLLSSGPLSSGPDEALPEEAIVEAEAEPESAGTEADAEPESAGTEADAEPESARAEAAPKPESVAEAQPAEAKAKVAPAAPETKVTPAPPLAPAAPETKVRPVPTGHEPEPEAETEAATPSESEPATPGPAEEQRTEENAAVGVFEEDPEPPGLDEEARRRVTEKNDLELGELYGISATRADESSNDEEHAYWTALVRAIVEESAVRPDFGQTPQGESSGGRLAERRRSKTLKPLMEARQTVLEQPRGGAGSDVGSGGP